MTVPLTCGAVTWSDIVVLTLGEGALRQRRFWEYNIPSGQGLSRRLDYLHYHHVKQLCIERLAAWTLSIFHRFVKFGYYERDWGGNLTHEKLD